MDELKEAVMYAFDYGTEELEESKIPYVKTKTVNIVNTIKSGLTEIESIHIDYLNTDVERKDIPIDKFIYYLMHLSQSGIFADIIHWRYVELFESGDYLIEGDINHNNGYELIVAITVINKEDRSKVAEILGKTED